MHEGNLFIDDNGNIVPVDFGIMGRLDKSNKKYLAEILWLYQKVIKVAEVHFQAGLVPETASKEEFAQALRSVGLFYKISKIFQVEICFLNFWNYWKI